MQFQNIFIFAQQKELGREGWELCRTRIFKEIDMYEMLLEFSRGVGEVSYFLELH